jgi:phosphopantothenoylcysteine decarboxylase/phosphopantothenate--cysteine ligase
MKVALGITGCIAAYKAVEVMRGLQKAGVSVHVIMTRAARRFVAPLTFESLSGNPVITSMFSRGMNREIEHIRLAQDVKLFVVVPATADVLGKFSAGVADDFLSTFYLSCPAPVVLAPAMNVEMWNHPAVRRNIEVLRSRGHVFVDPEAGMLACGMQGEGRLAEVDVIVARILEMLGGDGSLAGFRVLVTAGPTIEDLDPVRFISNRSSGKMGYAVARAARLRGADVVLVSGPTALPPPPGVKVVQVRSAGQMKDAVLQYYPGVDLVVKAAAVADYRAGHVAEQKIRKSSSPASIELVPNEDILELLGKTRRHQVLVGFAAETGDLEKNARSKMKRKNLDFIVANDVSGLVFGEDSATVQILASGGESVEMRQASKPAIADRILDMAKDLMTSRKAHELPELR